jgi:hypothetical protein
VTNAGVFFDDVEVLAGSRPLGSLMVTGVDVAVVESASG